MKRVSIQRLNNLFAFLNDIDSVVMWMRDLTFRKQIYVSPNYDSVWGHSSEKLYNYPESFKETVFIEDRNIHQLATKTKSTVEKINSLEDKIYLYRIQNLNSKLVHIKDWHYLFTDEDDNPLGYLGFAKNISAKEWHNEIINSNKHQMKKYEGSNKRTFNRTSKKHVKNCQNFGSEISRLQPQFLVLIRLFS